MTVTVWLRPNFSVLVDEEDAHLLSAKRYRPNQGYACRDGGSGEPRSCYLHRDILGAARGQIVDHINRVKHDCRRANLRIANSVTNGWNTSKRTGSTSSFRGVIDLATPTDALAFLRSQKRKRWAARLRSDGRTLHVGVYATEIEAAIAYDEVCRALRGEFAVLNFPDTERKTAA